MDPTGARLFLATVDAVAETAPGRADAARLGRAAETWRAVVPVALALLLVTDARRAAAVPAAGAPLDDELDPATDALFVVREAATAPAVDETGGLRAAVVDEAAAGTTPTTLRTGAVLAAGGAAEATPAARRTPVALVVLAAGDEGTAGTRRPAAADMEAGTGRTAVAAVLAVDDLAAAAAGRAAAVPALVALPGARLVRPATPGRAAVLPVLAELPGAKLVRPIAPGRALVAPVLEAAVAVAPRAEVTIGRPATPVRAAPAGTAGSAVRPVVVPVTDGRAPPTALRVAADTVVLVFGVPVARAAAEEGVDGAETLDTVGLTGSTSMFSLFSASSLWVS